MKIIIIPTAFGAAHRNIASAISKVVHANGGFCCHTSAESPSFEQLEERHQIKVREALDQGESVFCFNASTELVNMGVGQLGNMQLNGVQRVEALFAAE